MNERLCETSIEFEIPFHDVDMTLVVWHGHYYKYFELARTALLRKYNLDEGSDLIGVKYGFFVVESKCRHISPLKYGDRARVTAWIHETERRLLISYDMHNLTRARRAARAHTILVTVNMQGKLLMETPDEIVRRIFA